MSSSVLILAGVLVAALAFGLWRRHHDGRVREVRVMRGPDVRLGDTATLVQFSSSVCAPCATARRILGHVASSPDVVHVEIDVEQNMALVEQYGVTRTPTVLLLDRVGDVRQRVVGVPRAPELTKAVDDLRTEVA